MDETNCKIQAGLGSLPSQLRINLQILSSLPSSRLKSHLLSDMSG